MISYELAKKLKDAGFPQTVPYTSHNFKTSDQNKIGGTYEACVVPTLSELIEACGDRFHCLIHELNGGIDSNREFWSAGYNEYAKDWQTGQTPEEAVAMLWLKLNEK